MNFQEAMKLAEFVREQHDAINKVLQGVYDKKGFVVTGDYPVEVPAESGVFLALDTLRGLKHAAHSAAQTIDITADFNEEKTIASFQKIAPAVAKIASVLPEFKAKYGLTTKDMLKHLSALGGNVTVTEEVATTNPADFNENHYIKVTHGEISADLAKYQSTIDPEALAKITGSRIFGAPGSEGKQVELKKHPELIAREEAAGIYEAQESVVDTVTGTQWSNKFTAPTERRPKTYAAGERPDLGFLDRFSALTGAGAARGGK